VSSNRALRGRNEILFGIYQCPYRIRDSSLRNSRPGVGREITDLFQLRKLDFRV
jgi:hypothetical protein